MYLDSIVCNLLLLRVKGNLFDAFTTEALSSLMSPLVLLLILNNAVLGIVTSLFLQVIQSFAQFHIFLQKLNSVVKAFASALELVITALVRQIVKNKGNTVCLQFHQTLTLPNLR